MQRASIAEFMFLVCVASSAVMCGGNDDSPSDSNGGSGDATGGSSATSGGAGGGANGGASAFAQVTKIFSSHCTGCHGATQSVRIVLANDDTLYSRLTTPLPATSCAGVTPVDAAHPTMSLLYQIVAGPIDFSSVSPNCKLNQMPNGCVLDSCLSASDIATIQNWIKSGAPND